MDAPLTITRDPTGDAALAKTRDYCRPLTVPILDCVKAKQQSRPRPLIALLIDFAESMERERR